MEVTLTIHTVEGVREVTLAGPRLTLGRGDADVVIDDTSLSRIHASVNRDGDNVWVIDEESTNGTLVNNELVSPAGTPLKDGDEIYMGNTTIVVEFKADAQPEMVATAPVPARNGLPIPVIAAAGVIVILLVAIAIG